MPDAVSFCFLAVRPAILNRSVGRDDSSSTQHRAEVEASTAYIEIDPIDEKL
jgi:hypothetical protein